MNTNNEVNNPNHSEIPAENINKTAEKIQQNKKTILWASIGILAVVVIALVYVFLILNPAKENAAKTTDLADNQAYIYELTGPQVDSTGVDTAAVKVLSLYEVAAEKGHDGGNRATLMAAVYSYKTGDYNKAIKYLEDYDSNDVIIAASSKSLEGDCYANLDNFEKAIECFQEAAELSEDNPMLTPYFLLKEATIQHEVKNHTAEAQIYKTLMEKYPQYGMTNSIDFERYYNRATELANAKN